MSTAAAPAANGNAKTYTLKDLQENGTSQKLLMLLHDKGEDLASTIWVWESMPMLMLQLSHSVYDVTKFLDEVSLRLPLFAW
jgi:hypothetical protein